MVDLRVARRYANALFKVALQANTVQRTGEDLARLRELLRQSEAFRAFLYDPRIARDRKKERIRQLLHESVMPETLRAMELIIEKRREKLFEAICDEYQKLQETHQGIVRATITSAVPLTQAEQTALVQKLEQGIGKQIIPTYEVNPDLLGGVKVRMGDYEIDGSIRGALENLRERIRLEIERRTIAR